MERVITNRLIFKLEDERGLSEHQAGFRPRRSTEDQLLRLSQSISDGFHRGPMERTVLALFDFSKAYDTVWRDGLIWKLVKRGLPKTFVRWMQGWLTNRRNFVSFRGT